MTAAITLIWIACVATTWTPSTGEPLGYHTEIAGVRGPDVETNRYVVCLPEKRVPTALRVQGFNATGAGPWSDPLTLERVHDFDHTGDGSVGMADFGACVGAYGCRYLPGGLAENCR